MDNLSGKSELRQIYLEENVDSLDVILKGNGKMKYSALKEDFPLGVNVYLHGASFAREYASPDNLSGGQISMVTSSFMDEKKETVLVRILLRKDAPYEVREEGSDLRISFYRNQSDFLNQAVSFDSSNSMAMGHGQMDSANASAYGKDSLSQNDHASQDDLVFQNDHASQDDLVFQNNPVSQNDQLSNLGDAFLTGIDFHTGRDGETSIVIKTSRQVDYKIEKSRLNDHELRLNLFDTLIPDEHRGQLVTTQFDSAVDRILPVNRIGDSEPSRIFLQLRDRVPYHLLQEGANITLFLEPSTIKVASSAMTSPVNLSSGMGLSMQGSAMNGDRESSSSRGHGSSMQEPAMDRDREPSHVPMDFPVDSEMEFLDNMDDGVVKKTESFMTDSLFDDAPVYRGEKISLDFYETDIKNVFRILRTVSGDNFAIDKDVSGNVTLALDKPVPWDQVLDLVLKMNDLGKVREGSIIRIATLATLKREEAARQEMFAARKRALEQKKELEPLITEYIAINYSSADGDIRPHLEKLLTPDRGQISVDKRTNMIILTDVKEKIDQARKLIFKLDKVTPQIMISARIVEVNKEFSRELGVNWDIASQDVYRDDIGGLYGFDVAMNYPSSTRNGIGYTFNRLAGTSLLLDARLTASELNGDSKIISSPKILTLDNKTAKIDQGLEYGYQSGVDENGNPVISFKPVKLSLEVTPQVTPDKRVAMTVKISKNEVSGTVANIPSLSTNEAQTELLVNDGNTIVIGGIVKTNVSEGRTGFPLLSDIPYLGHIFRSDISSDRKNELLIFITPTIVQLDQRNNVL
ncbi:MAG: type IV pilus secretin PilQ [Desulfamplus sp.]|nr:type IV pilus secretin PilQ [Desulfamplus sp.]